MNCVTCGWRYRKADAATQFNNHFGGIDYQSEITYGSAERDLCGDCAIEYMESKIRSQEGYVDAHVEAEIDEDGERLSPQDAANIWLSRGMDEDYTFGYSEAELRRAADLD